MDSFQVESGEVGRQQIAPAAFEVSSALVETHKSLAACHCRSLVEATKCDARRASRRSRRMPWSAVVFPDLHKLPRSMTAWEESHRALPRPHPCSSGGQIR